MEPNHFCLEYLAKNQFIRNYPVDEVVKNNASYFEKNELLWYCVGTINSIRYVHCLQFLKKTPQPGITSYFIKWFNTAPYSTLRFEDMPDEFDSVTFWIHSGVALRKNLFKFQDRMSLLRSTFYYDEISGKFYRLGNLSPYLQIPEEFPLFQFVFTSLEKRYQYQKRLKKNSKKHINKKHQEMKKSLKKFIIHHNVNHFVEIEYPKLFHQIEVIFSKDGDPA